MNFATKYTPIKICFSTPNTLGKNPLKMSHFSFHLKQQRKVKDERKFKQFQILIFSDLFLSICTYCVSTQLYKDFEENCTFFLHDSQPEILAPFQLVQNMDTWKTLFFSHMYTLHLLCISTSTPPPPNQDSASWKISAKTSLPSQQQKKCLFKRRTFFLARARAIRKILN